MSDKLDPALRALLDAERSAPIAGAAEAKAQIFAAVSGAGAAGAAGAGAASAAGAWSTKALLWVALSAGGVGAALGSVATSALMKPVDATPSVSVSERVPAPPPQPLQPPQPENAPTPEAEAEVEGTRPQPSEVPNVAPSDLPRRARVPSEMAQVPGAEEADPGSQAEPSTLAAERALIDQALSALRANSGQNALRALMSHERRFAGGALSEERDRLSVEALVQLGRVEQARRRAQLFETRYPSSAHLQRVRSLVQ